MYNKHSTKGYHYLGMAALAYAAHKYQQHEHII